MAKSVVLTKTAAGNYHIVETDENGVEINNKSFSVADFTESFTFNTIKLIPPARHENVMTKAYIPEEWTVGLTTGFTTRLEVSEAITTLANS